MPVLSFAQVAALPPPDVAEPEPSSPLPEMHAAPADHPAGQIEVALPNGVTVRVGRDVDEAALRRVLAAVTAR